MTTQTVLALARAYRRGEADATQVVDAHLARAEAIQPSLNPFVVIDLDGARRAAAESADRLRAGTSRSMLEGVPVTVKDNVAVAGLPMRSGSCTTSDAACDRDAPAVARIREAGAVILGKTTTPEFGWKGITDSPLSGTTRNPWDRTRSSGGSSGGAAAALAAGVGVVALGNDGGGSIRIPASYCGLIGFKPTFGRVPHAPMDSPFSLNVSNGPIAHTVHDAALLLNELTRFDARDPWALPPDGRDWTLGLSAGIRGLRVAVTTELGGAEGRDADVLAAFERTVELLRDLGARVESVGAVFPPLRPRFEAHWKAGFAHILRAIPEARRPLCDPGFLALANEGLEVSMATYAAAMAARAELITELAAFHQRYELLVTPTMPTVAPPADVIYHSVGFDRWTHGVPYTVPFNLTGQPAGSVPVAVSPGGLPIGVQVVAARHADDLVLRAMRAVESAADFPQPHPRLSLAIQSLAGGS